MGLSEADLFALDESAELSLSTCVAVPSKPYLSDTIDYDTDIAPHQFIRIYSGVGSGKNTFVNHLVKGDLFRHHDGTLVSPQYVYLISSRKAKIQEMLNLDDVVYDPYVGMFDSFTNDWMAYTDDRHAQLENAERIELEDALGLPYEVCLRSCVCTNAKVEYDLKNRYSAGNPTAQPWNRFDMIIIDEAHSLLSDATYQSSAFYVRRLIQKTLKNSKTCKVIVMTGSPKILEKHPVIQKAHLIDRMETCINVTPKSVRFITKEESAALQQQMLIERRKFIAFYNHVSDILALAEKAPAEAQTGIAMAFSKAAVLDQMKKTQDPRLQRMLDTQTYLAKHEKLPDDVFAFLSTSKNKEGINIKNEDIHTMFIEAHAELDVIQMAGRLRQPVDVLYVVADSQDHIDYENSYEHKTVQDKKLRAAINDQYFQICRETGYEPNDPQETWQEPAYANKERKGYIDFTHGKYRYLRYDYFSDCFRFYPERVVGRKYYAEQRRIFSLARQSKAGLIYLAHRWFPGIKCTVSDQVEYGTDKKQLVDEYLEKNGWLEADRLGAADRTRLLHELNQLLKLEAKQLKSLLKSYGYDIKELTASHKTNAPFRVIKLDAVKAA